MQNLLNIMGDLNSAFNEREQLYSSYCSEESVEMQEKGEDNFRLELLRHLAGNIVVREHRMRYQKEQFDRFMASGRYHALKNHKMTLNEFAHTYALLIETMVENSHNDRCPKIEANYDDFGEKTIRPLNATIFYYFFSANRMNKMWAQWMLSAARYPNDRVRRAYMRMFA